VLENMRAKKSAPALQAEATVLNMIVVGLHPSLMSGPRAGYEKTGRLELASISPVTQKVSPKGN